jgi:hypothetical protein
MDQACRLLAQARPEGWGILGGLTLELVPQANRLGWHPITRSEVAGEPALVGSGPVAIAYQKFYINAFTAVGHYV